ncbi:MAG: N-acetylmuramoyl-L-alanine amidase [Armatimonadetes bacterium]|nr:N-acetylmuramoyl-L-alanine amidase [Armatimonadota bacterium]MDW8121064.1 N-acetylmuramoyl-L-alanine amidase [Armatimonadota bacterium]
MVRRGGLLLFILLFLNARSSSAFPLVAEPTFETVTLVVLHQVFPKVPVVWEEGPLIRTGDWMSALGLHWDDANEVLSFLSPNGGTEKVNVADPSAVCETEDDHPLPNPVRKINGDWFFCLKDLSGLLELKVLIHREESLIRIGIPVQGAQIQAIAEGYLVEVQVSRPLPQSPTVRTLFDPSRAYIDLPGAVLASETNVGAEAMGPVTGLRIGQFRNVPNIARLVADCDRPVKAWLVGRKTDPSGKQTWMMLIQEEQKKSPWMGQVSLESANPTQCQLVLTASEDFPPIIENKGKEIVLTLPARPLLPPSPFQPSEGPIGSIKFSSDGPKAILVVGLRQPSWGFLRFEKDRGWVLTIEPLKGASGKVRLIVVDPGHGGKDPGAIAHPPTVRSPLVEKSLTLDIAFRLKALLDKAGFRTVLTRTQDTYVPLPDRVALANSIGADAFVSIHLNSYPTPGGKSGTEVYYWSPQSRSLAETLYRNLLATLGRGGNGVRVRQFYVIHHTKMPSALTESCYLNHPEEAALLVDPQFRQKIANALFKGILEFFQVPALMEKRQD